MAELWNTILIQPLTNGLFFLYKFTGDLGLSIILFTILLRLLMTPLVLPSLRMSKKMQELAPELAKLKIQFKDNKQGLVTAQADLYKKNGANPAAGCLPQIVQLVILIALFNSMNLLLSNKSGAVKNLNKVLYSTNQLTSSQHLSTRFLGLNLISPDVIKIPSVPIPLPGIFLLLSAAVQLLSGKMMAPNVVAEKKVAEKTDSGSDDAMVAAQQQMLYLFPLMTIVIGFQFPFGLVLYWLVFSLIQMLQQYIVSGWGGLTPWLKRVNLIK